VTLHFYFELQLHVTRPEKYFLQLLVTMEQM